MRKSSNSNEEPAYKKKEKERAERLLKMQHLCEAFNNGMRVSKEIRVNDATNSLLLVKSVKYGTIVGRSVSSGNLHQLLVLWDGSSVPVPEMPYLLTEDW